MNAAVDVVSHVSYLLDRLAQVRDWQAVLEEELRVHLQTTAPELVGYIEAADKQAQEVDSAIRQSTLVIAQTIQGATLQAVYVRGRTSWDGKALDGFAAAHPEILAFRKTGEPSVTVRARG